MVSLLAIQINCAVCVVAGMVLNPVLLWLIARRTGKELRSYSRIMALVCVIDIVLLVIYAVALPVSAYL
jgi:Serpentine type 7TM GPCR chemoreceptor Srd